MEHDRSSQIFTLAARDLAALAGAREGFSRHLVDFAKRRAARYAEPESAPEGEGWWTDLAAALAPVLPSEQMPMWGLIDAGITLEGGAKGLRSLFASAPSERERRKALRTATLASRVMAIVAHADGELAQDEARAIAMVMASFGLSSEELAEATSAGPTRASQLEVFGELDFRVRRELLRGAWQLALQRELSAEAEDEVLTIAAKFELSAELGAVRREVADALARSTRVATLAVELALGASPALDPERRVAALEHVIRAAAPPRAAAALRARARGESGAPAVAQGGLVGAQRVQAATLAWSALRAMDARASCEALMRVRLRAAAARLDLAGDAANAMELVDRYLIERLAESADAPRAEGQVVAPQ